MPAAKPCTFNNTEFESHTAAAHAFGVSSWTITRWLQAGYTTLADVPPKRGMKPRIKYVWNDVEYPDIDSLADATYVTPHGAWWRLRRGHTGDASMRGYGDAAA